MLLDVFPVETEGTTVRKDCSAMLGLYFGHFGYRLARLFFSSAKYSKHIIFITSNNDFLLKGKIMSEIRIEF